MNPARSRHCDREGAARRESATGDATRLREGVRPSPVSQETYLRPANSIPRGKGGPNECFSFRSRGPDSRARGCDRSLAPATAPANPKSKAASVGALLRVIDAASGSPLADFTAYTGTATIPTSKQAKCFRRGDRRRRTRSSSRARRRSACCTTARPTLGLAPLSVTDHFLDEFGPGVCGIGSSVASGSAYWDSHCQPQRIADRRRAADPRR